MENKTKAFRIPKLSLKKISEGLKTFKDSYGNIHNILKKENSFSFISLVNGKERVRCLYYWTSTRRSWDFDKIASQPDSNILDLGLVNVHFCKFDPIFSDKNCAFIVEFNVLDLKGYHRFCRNITFGANSSPKFVNDTVIIEKSDWFSQLDFEHVVQKFNSRNIKAIKFKIENRNIDAEIFCNYVNFNAKKMVLANKKYCQNVEDIERKIQGLRNEIRLTKRKKELFFSDSIKT